MFQPYPAVDVDQRPPASVLTAVKLMYAGAVLSAIGVVVQFIGIPSERAHLRHQHNPKLSSDQIHSIVIGSVVLIAVIGIVSIGLWIWMARSNGAGKPWARIVSSVLFVLSTLDLLTSLRELGFQIGLILGLLIWLVGLAAIIMLWRQESTAYFKGTATPAPLTP